MANISTTIRNETSVGSFHTHQWPHDALAHNEPVTSAPMEKISAMWMAT